ncbi:glycoside-pentoside-hexuronide (GPH):cation symporter [Ruminococcaceae bacterium OttesenSCG-928-A11]|nr:glycoside-pentoside-hexuronide (GPH):cation symporter [Ruminococcaceae bacterium OttesenSCG-928-A11]
MKNVVDNTLKSSKKEKVLYSLGDVGVNLVWILPSSFLTLYYTDSVGMSAAYIGTMMLICRLFDGVSDILMGAIIDKTRTRWGKARPWLLFMGIPMVISVFLVFFMPQGLSESGQKIYAFVTYFIMSVICYTAVNLSYHALLPRFSLTSQDRSTVTAIRSICAMVATLVVMALTPSLIEAFGGDNNQRAWSTIVLLYGAIAAASILITFFGVKERLPLDTMNNEGRMEKTPLRQGVKILLSSRYFYISIVLFLSFYIANGTSGINIYYARDVLGDANLFGLMSVVSLAPMLLAMPFMPLLFKKVGKRNAMLAGMLFSLAATACMLINPRNIVLFFVLSFIRSIGAVPVSTAMYTLAGDIVDYNQWKKGIRTEGIATSVNSIGMKLGTGLGSAILGWMLAWGHYDGTAATQPESAISAMIIVAIVVPIVIYVVSAVLLLFWDLDEYQPEVTVFIQKQHQQADS